MTPERWQQVERVFYVALAADVSARPALVDQACAGDGELRREVMKLLENEPCAEHFLGEPALEMVARMSYHTHSVVPGTQIGAYRVLGALGTGGMGEVYRARDTHLGRDVALKVLPDVFLADPARRRRFDREARLLAALNHPHVGAIYGLEDLGGSHVLVLEFIDGESLAQRLAAGALPVAQATAFGRQIADALEAAHDKGIVHRDLKPTNIMVTADDQVKVLDFGLARAADANGASHASDSPTLTIGNTRAGVLLGTAAYMSPEQAQGRVADKRSDVWAFGCVLYEMLGGSPAFEGSTVSDTLASVLRDAPDWTKLPGAVPTELRTLLRRCLEKDRNARIPEMAVARFLLEDATAVSSPGRSRSRTRLVATIAPALLASAATGLAVWTLMRPTQPSSIRVVRLPISLSPSESLATTDTDRPLAISADGRYLVFVGRLTFSSAAQLLVESLDQLGTGAGLRHRRGPESLPLA
jgi:serine/threonine protein kinase